MKRWRYRIRRSVVKIYLLWKTIQTPGCLVTSGLLGHLIWTLQIVAAFCSFVPFTQFCTFGIHNFWHPNHSPLSQPNFKIFCVIVDLQTTTPTWLCNTSMWLSLPDLWNSYPWTSQRRCFTKRVLFKVLQNSQRNTCVGVSFLKFQAASFELY